MSIDSIAISLVFQPTRRTCHNSRKKAVEGTRERVIASRFVCFVLSIRVKVGVVC